MSFEHSVRPKLPGARAKGKAPPNSSVGLCLICGEQAIGPDAIRLRHGCIRQRKWAAVEFHELPFEDHDKVKWLCFTCALDLNLLAGNGQQFSSKLEGLSDDGQCCLCREVIEPYPLEDWSSAIQIELGTMIQGTKAPVPIFHPLVQGHLHYFCVDDLGVSLWRLIEPDDVPDLGWDLP